MWIRQPFLDSRMAFDRVVVHGHTPTPDVHADHRRIGMDTKAYHSGVLSAVRLQRHERSLLQAIGPRRGSEARSGGAEPLYTDDAGVVLHTERLEPLHAEIEGVR